MLHKSKHERSDEQRRERAETKKGSRLREALLALLLLAVLHRTHAQRLSGYSWDCSATRSLLFTSRTR